MSLFGYSVTDLIQALTLWRNDYDTLSAANTLDVTLAAVGSTPAAAGASISAQVLTLQPADATHPGVVTIGTQSIAGAKTFTGALVASSTLGVTGDLTVGASKVVVDSANGRVTCADYVVADTYYGKAAAGAKISGQNSAGNSTLTVDNTAGALTTGRILVLKSSTVEKAAIDKYGRLTMDATDASGTPGAATIDKPSGQVAIDTAAASVVVTNALVSATSVVLAQIQTADATLISIKSVVPGSGTFTITGNAAATAPTKIGFVVFN